MNNKQIPIFAFKFFSEVFLSHASWNAHLYKVLSTKEKGIFLLFYIHHNCPDICFKHLREIQWCRRMFCGWRTKSSFWFCQRFIYLATYSKMLSFSVPESLYFIDLFFIYFISPLEEASILSRTRRYFEWTLFWGSCSLKRNLFLNPGAACVSTILFDLGLE